MSTDKQNPDELDLSLLPDEPIEEEDEAQPDDPFVVAPVEKPSKPLWGVNEPQAASEHYGLNTQASLEDADDTPSSQEEALNPPPPPRLGFISDDELASGVRPTGDRIIASDDEPLEDPLQEPVSPPLEMAGVGETDEVGQSVDEETTAALSAGQILREARERQGLSITDVMQHTHLSADTIQALEEDREPAQTARVYIRGFYSRYAKMLDLPEGPLLAAYAQRASDAEPAAAVPFELAPQDVSPPSRWPLVIIVMLLGIGVGVLAWWLQPKPAVEPQPAAPTSEPSAAAAPAEVVEVIAPAATEVEPTDVNAGIPAESEPASEAQAFESAEPAMLETTDTQDTAVAVPAVAGSNRVLELEYLRESWTGVTDAEGTLLFEGMVPAGEKRRFVGELPLKVFIGTATAVTATFAGEPVDIAAYTRPNGTARLVLDN